jgi:YaiO family outer membrane protein
VNAAGIALAATLAMLIVPSLAAAAPIGSERIAAASAAFWRSSAQMLREAQVAVKRRDYRAARRVYLELAGRHPEEPDYFVWLGRLDGWLRDYTSALSHYDRALTLDPDDVEALVGKAYVLMWQREFSAARPLLERAVLLAPRDSDVTLALARFYIYQDEREQARDCLARTLAIDPDNEEALDLDRRIPAEHRFELQLGYEHDWFDFFTPGNVGTENVGYLGNRTRFFLTHEIWDRFARLDQRLGLRLGHQFFERTDVHCSFLYGPFGDTVIPREDVAVGVAQGMPYGFAPGLDYRYMHFAAADVHLITPSVDYYLDDQAYIHLAFYQAFVMFAGKPDVSSLQSYYVQCNKIFHEFVTLHAGYAYGAQAFSAITADTLGVFTSHALIAGADFKVTPTVTLGASYTWEVRSNAQRLESLAFNLTVLR